MVKYWKDKCYGELTLGEAFLPLFSIAIAKDPCVVEVWEWEGSGNVGTLVSQDSSMIRN